MNLNGAILLVGGYGVVGKQIAELFRQRNPERPVVLAGRSLERGRAAAAGMALADAAVADVMAEDPLAGLSFTPGAVVSIVNDPADNLLRAAIRRGLPLIDIARWTQRLMPALVGAAALTPRAPVIFASSWMAGAPGLIAAHLASGLARTDSIALNILYALKDKAGPNSVEYADQLTVPFQVLEGGVWRRTKPLTSPRRVAFSGARTFEVRRFCTPDLEILPRLTGARSVDVRIGYDDPGAGSSIAFLVTSGLWGAISGPRFEGLRRSMLYHPGDGAGHEVRIEIEGEDAGGARRRIACVVEDAQGQTHMTAAGAVLQIERVLGLHGASMPAPGVQFAESHAEGGLAIEALRGMGVTIAVS